jgi:hypothetical protein
MVSILPLPKVMTYFHARKKKCGKAESFFTTLVDITALDTKFLLYFLFGRYSIKIALLSADRTSSTKPEKLRPGIYGDTHTHSATEDTEVAKKIQ